MAKLYKLTDGEKEIIRKAQEENNPNWFTNWFLKSETSGYYVKPDVLYKPYTGHFPEKYQEFVDRYRALFAVWEGQGKPEQFVHKGKDIQVRKSRDYQEPIFHMHFGSSLQDWQLDLYKAPQRIKVALGGYGSGKTVMAVLMMLYWAATVPGFRGLFLAPNSNQAKESWRIAMQLMYATPYMSKFLLKKNSKDPPSITIGNDLVGSENLIQTFPIDDPQGVGKLETLTLDFVVIDQAEKMDNIAEIRRVIGSRFRGQVMGRDIVGQMLFLANAKDNPELWDLFDESIDDPNNIKAVAPATFDNIFITPEQLEKMESDVGGTEEDIRVHIKGGRPLLAGEHFPVSIQNLIKSPLLDQKMEQALNEHQPGYIHIVAPKIGTILWEMPPENDRNYLVVADPGTDNPPNRNSAVILVWDYTDFPKAPATLQCFAWVYGNHRPEPWVQKYTEYVTRYRAKISNAFDSTAWQSGWQESLWAFNNMIAGGMMLHINYKARYLNFTKRMCERELFKVPSIQGFFTQLGRYTLPDQKLKQDIVMAFILSGGWLEHLLYGTDEGVEGTDDHPIPALMGRYDPELNGRYNVEMAGRY